MSETKLRSSATKLFILMSITMVLVISLSGCKPRRGNHPTNTGKYESSAFVRANSKLELSDSFAESMLGVGFKGHDIYDLIKFQDQNFGPKDDFESMALYHVRLQRGAAAAGRLGSPLAILMPTYAYDWKYDPERELLTFDWPSTDTTDGRYSQKVRQLAHAPYAKRVWRVEETEYGQGDALHAADGSEKEHLVDVLVTNSCKTDDHFVTFREGPARAKGIADISGDGENNSRIKLVLIGRPAELSASLSTDLVNYPYDHYSVSAVPFDLKKVIVLDVRTGAVRARFSCSD